MNTHFVWNFSVFTVLFLVFQFWVILIDCKENVVEQVLSESTRYGRINAIYPSPRCCSDNKCVEESSENKYLALTFIRSEEYVPLVRNLICSIRNTNPNVSIAIGIVDGDLSNESMKFLHMLSREAKLIYFDDIYFPNSLAKRYELNWVKLRAWGMEEYSGILVIDADTIVLDDISHIFSLPAQFACALDEDKGGSPGFTSLGSAQGGVFFLRPCKAVLNHMLELLGHFSQLRFSNDHAEQSFLEWYFHFEKWTFPSTYNAIYHHLDSKLMTRAGIRPHIVHFTRKNVQQNPWGNVNLETSLKILEIAPQELCSKVTIDLHNYIGLNDRRGSRVSHVRHISKNSNATTAVGH